ncbi:hypothetical protein SAMN02745885_02147 [Carboxydocella sporoproducens DSM 16521]|uniref:Uncharacterized protein n=1 Tax=Carboxydocella sporoproducens DSM 16521 TaxID=1121270 RepID=A0A1T4RIX0_9FIRM|nr:hypothetical protein SAMN02745885_02147 [Carboxydocella sporoproducens DSM 16521]
MQGFLFYAEIFC